MIHMLYVYSSTDGLSWYSEIDLPMSWGQFRKFVQRFREMRDQHGLKSLPDLSRDGQDNQIYCIMGYNEEWRRWLALVRQDGIKWSLGAEAVPSCWGPQQPGDEHDAARKLVSARMEEGYYQIRIHDSSTPMDWEDALCEKRLPRDGDGIVDFGPTINSV
jgi:hypothetical protein